MQVARVIVFDIRNAEANNPNFIFSAEVKIFKYYWLYFCHKV
jgi:hypothetical protein